MTNIKSLTGAIALLAIIAVLDNYLIVELEPVFEGMLFVDADGVDSDPAGDRAEESPNQQAILHEFWIDKHKVSRGEFTKFVESTNYTPLALAGNNDSQMANAHSDLTASASREDWKNRIDNASWQLPATSVGEGTMSTQADYSELRVSFDDALAYCNWLGKELPNEDQFEYLSRGKALTLGDAGPLHHALTHADHWQAEKRKAGVMSFSSDGASFIPSMLSSNADPNSVAGFRCVKNPENSNNLSFKLF